MFRDRNSRRRSMGLVLLLAVALVGVGLAAPAQATPPVVKTVPWVATNSLIPHDTWAGKTITLKGTADVQGSNYQWKWDFGDGSPVATGTVGDRYDIEATHAYTGTLGNVFTATLTVTELSSGDATSKHYYVKLQAQALPVEVNVAIDEGLWYLHKTMYRYHYDTANQDLGYWNSGYAGSGYYAIWAANTNAFEVNGHLETGDPDNPYTETVARAMRQLFYQLYSTGIGNQTNPLGTFSPDGNSNGVAIFVNQSYPFYQGGSFVDAIVASGTKDATVGGTGPLAGRTFLSVVQDMVDGYAYCQYTGGTVSPPYGGGGWRYNCGDWPDNSPSQWGAISIIPAVREWGVHLDSKVTQWNQTWLKYSWDGNGFGYTSPGYYPWGPYAVTPSGMVQMVMDGIGRGNAMWNQTESYMRDNFDNPVAWGTSWSVKAYYYGLFSFVKSLLLSPCPTPAACGRDASDTTQYGIKLLHSSSGSGKPDIDWYSAEASAGATSDGIARTLVNGQNAGGFWYGHNASGDQYPFETAWAIMMLNRVVFTGGAPVAVGVATPNPAVSGAMVTLDGSGSFSQDPTKTITQWDWDIGDGKGFNLHGVKVQAKFTADNTKPLPQSFPVTLRVFDNAQTPATASSILNVVVNQPPLPPTANAGGPYNFCLPVPAGIKWSLDGSGTVNPDQGLHQTGPYPPDTIYGDPHQFAWDLSGNQLFNDAYGVTPDVTSFFTAKGAGSYLIALKVTDTTALSFPSSGLGNLSDTATGQVVVRLATDPQCSSCISNLTALSKNRIVGLSWKLTGADHYNVYRSDTNGGPYQQIGTATAAQSVYTDTTVTNGKTYYYVVRPATLGDIETCTSNQASGLPKLR